jgi:hypothetical protein
MTRAVLDSLAWTFRPLAAASVIATGSRDIAPHAGGMGEAREFRGRDVRGHLSVSDTEWICRRRDRSRSKPVCVKRQCLAASKLARAEEPRVMPGPGVTDPKRR